MFTQKEYSALELMAMRVYSHRDNLTGATTYRFCDAHDLNNIGYFESKPLLTVESAREAKQFIACAYIGWVQNIKHPLYLEQEAA